MGSTVYRDALADPESLAIASEQPGVEDIFFEAFGGIVWEVLEERGVEPDYLPYPEDPAGERWKEEDLPKRFPKLWAIRRV